MKETITQEQFNGMFGIEDATEAVMPPVAFNFFSFVLVAQLFDQHGEAATTLGMMLLGLAVAAGADPGKLVTGADGVAGIDKLRCGWPE